MSHELEFIDGQAQIAYVGEEPWHGYGKRVPNDLTPDQMLKAAGLDWTVEKITGYVDIPDKDGYIQAHPIDRAALVRSSDKKIIDIVSNDWKPVQNKEAFEFFNEFVAAGDMEMHTAGSLKDGQIVWALAKIKDSFELFGGDQVDSYLHFTNFHKYGFSTDVRFTPIRVVCWNTLSLSLNSKVERMAKISHRREFKPEKVKEMLGIAKDKLNQYKEMAAFLGSKRAKDEDIVEYFKRIFTLNSNPEELSRNAKAAIELVHSQPGAKYAEGTWWQPYNAVTRMVDHDIGRSVDTRLASSWYGNNKNLKIKALQEAVKFAEAA